MDILLTGRSGFLGREIYHFFATKHTLHSIGRTSSHANSERFIKADLSRNAPELSTNFNLVIHAAGKAHTVPKTPKEKDTFYTENLNISKNLIYSLNKINEKPKYFIYISSVAVYGINTGIAITENTDLKATDSYGRSKVESEELITSWCSENNVVLTILRLPLIVGKNPPGNFGDMIKAVKKGRFPLIAGGEARRSMILSEDIPIFIDKIKSIGGVYNLTDGHDPSFKELASVLQKLYKSKLISIPSPVAKIMAFAGDIISKIISKDLPFNSRKLEKMTSSLTFSNKKAISAVDWKPTPVLEYYENFD